MNIQSTGGIFLRLDTNGNATFYKSDGTVLGYFQSGGMTLTTGADFLKIISVGTDIATVELKGNTGAASELIFSETAVTDTRIRRPAGSGNLQFGDPPGTNMRLVLEMTTGNLDFNQLVSSKSGNAVLRTKAGTPADTDFTSPKDGMVVVDTTASKLWTRIGGTWKGVAVA